MLVSYKRLFHIMVDRNMNKTDLHKATGVSWAFLAKLSKGETVNMEPLIRICKYLKCGFDDIVEILPDEEDVQENSDG
jgi:DNA-binding Xre family transcriptional regulator